MKWKNSAFCLAAVFVVAVVCGGFSGCNDTGGGSVPADIQAVFHKPLYKNSTWGLRVVDTSGKVLIDYNPRHKFFIGSVRKVFTIGELLDEIGPSHTYNTPVYTQGTIDDTGKLQGNLVLVASGDLAMGGRTNPDGTIAIRACFKNRFGLKSDTYA